MAKSESESSESLRVSRMAAAWETGEPEGDGGCLCLQLQLFVLDLDSACLSVGSGVGISFRPNSAVLCCAERLLLILATSGLVHAHSSSNSGNPKFNFCSWFLRLQLVGKRVFNVLAAPCVLTWCVRGDGS